jgi:CheY-like chemotaxis protein
MATTKIFLIVDDDADDREMFCEALAEVIPDCNCYTAPNGRRAIMALEEGEIAMPDLIFLDINMPVMNGWQCLSKLKETGTYNAIPVIMYSTSSYPEDVKCALRLGALCFFSKPSRYTELKDSLTVVGEHISKASLEALVQSSPMFLTGVEE